MLRVRAGIIALSIGLAGALSACAAPNQPNVSSSPVLPARASAQVDIDALIARMSLKHKIAQLIQPQINSFTARDMAEYRFGSYLNGGNGGPYGDEFAPPSQWLRLADEMWLASTQPLPGDEPVIPTMWGTDAVHGHTNVVGATIFPHNIALGATHDEDLVRRIGAATAAEIKATGIDWNFSPTVAVARDDRWGRTYESYSEDPALVARLGAALIRGEQGDKDSPRWLDQRHVIATAKHFFGDGGTRQGVDQGDVEGDLDKLKSIHAVPYPAAIKAGVQAIMASFNSINGKKMHGNHALLTDYLRGELGFDGLVVGDWNGHGQIKGCTVTNCPQALMAGLDIYMVPDDWKALHANLVAQVKDGTIPMARIDQAVRRVLRVKQHAGLLLPGAKKPSARVLGGHFDVLGSPQHRALAREAVAKSQVILKNDGVLPLKRGARVLVAGSAADSIGQAAGGWTLEWQGGRNLSRDKFPGATSIWEGLRDAVRANGGEAELSPDGKFASRPDVAVVVFGEQPYAEFAGDRKSLLFEDEEGLALLRKFQSERVPVVAVFLSGRPLWVNREVNAANAFVAAWLPGSEGEGVADVLTGARPASGRLSFSWPAHCEGGPVNGPENTLFPFGYGRSLTQAAPLGALSEQCALLGRRDGSEIFASGRLGKAVSALAYDPGKPIGAASAALTQLRGAALGVTARGIDRKAQEDAREIMFSAGSAIALLGEEQASKSYRLLVRLDQRPTAPVHIVPIGVQGRGRAIDITNTLAITQGKGWRELLITPACAPQASKGFGIESEGALVLQIAKVTRENLPEGTQCTL